MLDQQMVEQASLQAEAVSLREACMVASKSLFTIHG